MNCVMNDECAAITVQAETLWLHPERAVIWPARRTVIVADTHFGKSALFGRHGVAVPAGTDGDDRERLRRLVARTGAVRLIILGDFVHAPLEAGSADARDLVAWATGLCDCEISVIAGNHDRGAGGAAGTGGTDAAWPTRAMPWRWQESELVEPPFRFTHDAERGIADARLFSLSGHIHPVARLAGLRKRMPRVPIFWLRPSGLVLPSFGAFTGGYLVRPAPEDQVFAVGPERVVRLR
jgi:DNA ligase-associated metallophosphoesterase